MTHERKEQGIQRDTEMRTCYRLFLEYNLETAFQSHNSCRGRAVIIASFNICFYINLSLRHMEHVGPVNIYTIRE